MNDQEIENVLNREFEYAICSKGSKTCFYVSATPQSYEEYDWFLKNNWKHVEDLEVCVIDRETNKRINLLPKKVIHS